MPSARIGECVTLTGDIKKQNMRLMISPSFVLGFILATLYGSVFHFISGGDAARLALFFLASWIGFALGHITGDILNIELLDMGPLNALNATIGAVVALLVARLLTRPTKRAQG